VACRSEVVTDEGAFHKFISIAALHTANNEREPFIVKSISVVPRGRLTRETTFVLCFLTGPSGSSQSAQETLDVSGDHSGY
jgi:hypothetical protein